MYASFRIPFLQNWVCLVIWCPHVVSFTLTLGLVYYQAFFAIERIATNHGHTSSKDKMIQNLLPRCQYRCCVDI